MVAHAVPASAREALPAQASRELDASQIDGRNFPDHVLALTWDDGPDRHTLELAHYLKHLHISATFFVVQDWSPGVSSYPGYGPTVRNSGYDHIPVLQELIRLGHRVGNHTQHHVFLTRVDAAHAESELVTEQHAIAPFELDELSLFRAPGGAWTRALADEENAALGGEQVVGPVRWDVDRKDWENSVSCDSPQPKLECEHWRGGLRLKASVTAAHYLASALKAGHGIVLMHDRVADVGSHYALDVAHALLPALIAQGFVFTAPVLRFSPLSQRLTPNARRALANVELASWRFVDENDDGRSDLCADTPSGWTCLPSVEAHPRAHDIPKSMFGAERAGAPPVSHASEADATECTRRFGVEARLGDVNGDGRRDCCALSSDGIRCALADGATFEPASRWSAEPASPVSAATSPVASPASPVSASGVSQGLLLGDLNGDDRADVCWLRAGALACALSTGSGFTSSTVWARPGALPPGGRLALADVNGDARADLCLLERDLVSCGVAP